MRCHFRHRSSIIVVVIISFIVLCVNRSSDCDRSRTFGYHIWQSAVVQERFYVARRLWYLPVWWEGRVAPDFSSDEHIRSLTPSLSLAAIRQPTEKMIAADSHDGLFVWSAVPHNRSHPLLCSVKIIKLVPHSLNYTRKQRKQTSSRPPQREDLQIKYCIVFNCYIMLIAKNTF